jgi:serine/threonine-protein kinase
MLRQNRIGRYEVVSALGQGAMGAVYKAVDPLIERAVAIKTINLNLSKEERAEFEERFYREAKSAGRLSHANIVTIYDVGETDDSAYIAMEYLEGESLREMLDSGVVLPIEMIARIAARVANALHYAHENHVVHRDIKPANIMITLDRDVKIMDFGIAQIPTGSRTQLGTVLGSPKYMAPEQVAGRPTDGRTDIFALGVVLYEMLTGVTPFNGDNLSAIMYKVLNEEPAPPSTINRRVPQAFDRIISRALAKRPEDRYQTGREFARDLRNPDAASSQEARRPAASTKPAKVVQASRTFEEEPTTLFLQPANARGRAAVPSAGKGKAGKGKKAALKGKTALRKPLWLALPILILAAFAMVYQAPQPEGDKVASSVAQVTASSSSPAVDAAQPVVTPAVKSAVEPAVKLEATPVAEPAITPAVRPAVAPAPVATVRERPPPPQPAEQAKATLMVAVSPWGEVFVDGESIGVSPPLAELQIDAGRHDVEIRNQTFAPYRETVNLKSGQTLKIRHKFK